MTSPQDLNKPHSLAARLAWISLGFILGMASLSAARAATPKKIADDVAIYQNLREVRVQRAKPMNFDRDVERLAALETHFQEKLPGLSGHERLRKPMDRVSKRSYRYKGKRKADARARSQSRSRSKVKTRNSRRDQTLLLRGREGRRVIVLDHS